MTDTEDVDADEIRQSTQDTEPGIARRSRPSRSCRNVKKYDDDDPFGGADADEFLSDDDDASGSYRKKNGAGKKKQTTQEAVLAELMGDDDQDEDFQVDMEDAVSDEEDFVPSQDGAGGLLEDDIDVAAFEGQGGSLANGTVLGQPNGKSGPSANTQKPKLATSSKKRGGKKKSRNPRDGDDDSFIADSDSDGDADEWEDVDDLLAGIGTHATKTQRGGEGVEVSIDVGERKSAGTKRKPSRQELIIRQLKKRSREIQTDIHKTHLLTLIAHARWLFRTVFERPTLNGMILSMIPSNLMQEYKSPPHTAHKTNKLFRELAKLVDYVPTADEQEVYAGIRDEVLIQTALIKRKAPTLKHRCLIFGLMLRAIGFEVRLVWNMQPFQVQDNFKNAEKAARDSATKAKKDAKKATKSEKPNSASKTTSSKKSKKTEVSAEAVEVAPATTRARRTAKNPSKSENDAKPAEESKPTSRSRKNKVEFSPARAETSKSSAASSRSRRSTRSSAGDTGSAEKTSPYFDADANNSSKIDDKSKNRKKSKTAVVKSEPVEVAETKTHVTSRRTTRATAKTPKVEVKAEQESATSAKTRRGKKREVSSSPPPVAKKTARSSKRAKRDPSVDADDGEENSTNDDSGIRQEDDDDEMGSKNSSRMTVGETDDDEQNESKNSSRTSADDADSSGVQSASSIAFIGSKQSKKKQPSPATSTDSVEFVSDKLHILSAKLPKSTGRDFWLEVFCSGSSSNTLNKTKSSNDADSEYIAAGYITFDCLRGHMTRHDEMEREATTPLAYVTSFSFDSQCSMKDLTSRYAAQWIHQNRKLQVDRAWWAQTLAFYRPRQTRFERVDETALRMELLHRPLPRTANEVRAHPLYVILSQLRKYEAIWPPDTQPSGYVNLNKKNPDDKEALYLRENVVQLHARNKWLQQALTVKQGEQPYKVVKKWLRKKKRQRMGHDINTLLLNRLAGLDNNDEKLELFGQWQTEPYVPPTAEHGQVPRNEYGNVELFKASMMPGGCCKVNIPGVDDDARIGRVARKANIDIARAMVGWDSHKGHSHPMFDGWIVCKENHDKLLKAWKEHIAEKQEKEADEDAGEPSAAKKKGKKAAKAEPKASSSSKMQAETKQKKGGSKKSVGKKKKQ